MLKFLKPEIVCVFSFVYDRITSGDSPVRSGSCPQDFMCIHLVIEATIEPLVQYSEVLHRRSSSGGCGARASRGPALAVSGCSGTVWQ